MIAKAIRGDRMPQLIAYLLGPGKAHTDQHVIAGHDAVLHAAAQATSHSDQVLDIANALELPRKVYGTRVTVPVKEWDEARSEKVIVGRKDAHVWHLILSLGADEAPLTDQQWASISQDTMEGMGFVDPDGAKSSRWVAVRHGLSSNGNDHVHIAVSLVREDGTKADVHNDHRRLQTIAAELEHKYGLKVIESRAQDRETLRANTFAELHNSASKESTITARDELRRRLRAAAAASTNELQYVRQLRLMRVLVSPQWEKGGRESVRGYRVALMPDIVDGVRTAPVWYGPSKQLDKTLGLGALRREWGEASSPDMALHAWTNPAPMPARIKLPELSATFVERVNSEAGQVVIPADRSLHTELLATDVARLLAVASLKVEANSHGALAIASQQFARAGQPRRGARRTPPGYAMRLQARASSTNSAAGWLAVMRIFQRAASAVVAANRAERQLTTAATLTTSTTAAANILNAIQPFGATPRSAAGTRNPKPLPQPTTQVRDHDHGLG